MEDALTTLCAFAVVAGLVAVIAFLFRKAKRMAGLSALCSLGLAIYFPLLADMDARSKGFLDRHDLQAALNEDVLNPVAWDRVRGMPNAVPITTPTEADRGGDRVTSAAEATRAAIR